MLKKTSKSLIYVNHLNDKRLNKPNVIFKQSINLHFRNNLQLHKWRVLFAINT